MERTETSDKYGRLLRLRLRTTWKEGGGVTSPLFKFVYDKSLRRPKELIVSEIERDQSPLIDDDGDDVTLIGKKQIF